MSLKGDRPRQVSARKRRFLKAFRARGNVSEGARQAGICRQTVYKWLAEDVGFKLLMDEAEQVAIDKLEAEAFRRAHDGVQDYVVSQGKLVYIDDPETGERVPLVRRVYSDTLMVTLLKAHRPQKFKDRQEVTGPEGGPVKFTLNLRAGD